MNAWDQEIQRHDIRSLPYEEGSVDAVYSSHTLEHLYLDEARQVLAEAARVLRPGGRIRLALPDAVALARDLLSRPEDPEAGIRFNDMLLAHPASPPSGVRRLVARWGGHVHRWQPTSAMVARMLQEAGFRDVSEGAYKAGTFPDLEVIENRSESFFLEGKKP